MPFTMPTDWLEDFKKKLLAGNQATADTTKPLTSSADMAQARLQTASPALNGDPDLPTAESGGENRPPMVRLDPSLISEPQAGLPQGVPSGDIAEMRLQNAPAPPSKFTPRPEYVPEHKPGEAIGLGQRILHTLKGVGMGALRGSQYGLGGMIGGAAAGGIGAGVNPEFYHKLKYETTTLPMWRQRHEDEAEFAKTQQSADESQARITNTGVDNDLATRRLAIDERIRTGQGEDRDLAREDRAYQTWLEYGDPDKALTVEEAKRLGRPELVGRKSPATRRAAARAQATEYSKTETREGGVEYGLRKDTGLWEPMKTTAGEPFKKFQQPHRDPNELTPGERLGEKREARAERQEQESKINKAATDLRRGQDAIDRYLMIKDAPVGTGKGQMTEVEKEDARLDALHTIEEIASTHPDYLEGAAGTGGVPYIKWKGGKRPSVQGASRGGGSSSQKDPRIGKTYSGKDGKRYKVTGIDKDGDPIATVEP